MEQKGVLGLVLGVGVVVFAIGCEPAGPVATTSGQITVGQQAIEDRPEDIKLVDDWFEVYRTALSDLSMTKGHWEVQTDNSGNEERVWVDAQFGASRIPRMRGHDQPASTDGIGDRVKLKALLKDNQLHGRSWLYGSGTEVLTEENIKPRLFDSSRSASEPELSEADLAEVGEFAKRAYKELQKPDGAPRMKVREWDLQARMMRLNDEACLTCHTDNKLNDPVAVFVFGTTPKTE